MKSHIVRMLSAMSWADRRMLSALIDCPGAQVEALPLLSHVLAAENIWLARLRNQVPALAVFPELSLDAIQALVEDNVLGYASYVAALGDNDLTETVRYRNMKGEEFVSTVIDILTHVVIHGAYHRGQIAKVLGRNGVSAVSTDFLIYTRLIEPTIA